MDVAMVKSPPLPCPHVFYNIIQVLEENMPNFNLFDPNVWLWCLDTHTYKHTYEQKYVLKWVHGSNSLGPSIIQKKNFFWALFHIIHKWKRCSLEGFHLCYSQSQVVYAYDVLSLSLQIFFCQSSILAFLVLTWTQKCMWSYACT